MHTCLLSLVLLTAVTHVAHADPISIDGQTKYKPHSLVKLRASGANDKAALLWRISPSVQRATNPRGILEFAAPPGIYTVELLAITTGDGGKLDIQEATLSIEIEATIPRPDTPKPDTPKTGRLDPVNALGRIQFGNAGCTATVIGPRRNDGRWDVLTAAHCVSNLGQKGSLRTKDGKTIGITVVFRDRTPDVCWCLTDQPHDDLAYANLAPGNPSPGVSIWHAGYGIDRPTNREDGTVTAAPNADGQLRMVLSVSSGDSGGGIFRSDTNEVISTVCCTTGKGQAVTMYGGSTEIIRRTRFVSKSDLFDDWTPIEIPTCKD